MVSRKLFERTQKALIKSKELMQELARAEERDYGFTHGDKDLDMIIDSLDYGCGGMTYEEYVQIMKEANGEKK